MRQLHCRLWFLYLCHSLFSDSTRGLVRTCASEFQRHLQYEVMCLSACRSFWTRGIWFYFNSCNIFRSINVLLFSTCKFIILFKKYHHWFLTWTNSVEHIIWHSISLWSIWVLFYTVILKIINVLQFIVHLKHSTCLSHIILHLLGEWQKKRFPHCYRPVLFSIEWDNSRTQAKKFKFVGEEKLFYVQKKIKFPWRRKVLQLFCLYQQKIGLH
jgi:hypothetical protein